MTDTVDRSWVRQLLGRARYVVIATTDAVQPWAAPVEPLVDDDLNVYFFSPESSRHARDIEGNGLAAVAAFAGEQPDYTADTSAFLNGVQIEGAARKLAEDEYTDEINAAIEALRPPMPPYAVYKVEPRRVFVPRIEEGVNVRVEVDIT